MGIFTKQDSTKKPAIIVRRILELIETGELSSGDKLPPEMEIVKQSDISRTSVREALSALELMGVIERVPGEGTFINSSAVLGKFGSKGTLERFLEDTEGVGGSFEALEARMVLEPSVAAMAARRAEPEQIERLRDILERSEEALAKSDIKLFMDLDGEFHMAVAEATNNEEITAISRNLLKKADVHMWRRYKEDLGLLDATAAAHREIYQAIRDRDSQKAGFYTENHLARSAK